MAKEDAIRRRKEIIDEDMSVGRIAASLNENNTKHLLEQTKQIQQWISQQF